MFTLAKLSGVVNDEVRFKGFAIHESVFDPVRFIIQSHFLERMLDFLFSPNLSCMYSI